MVTHDLPCLSLNRRHQLCRCRECFQDNVIGSESQALFHSIRSGEETGRRREWSRAKGLYGVEPSVKVILCNVRSSASVIL